MRILRNKTKVSTIALVLLLTISITLVALPATNAQEIEYSKTTHAYIGAIPNPVGVGQEVLLHVGITDFLVVYTDGWEGLTVTVTKPDDTTETLGPFKTDSTGGTGTVYVPAQVGTYYLQTHFPQQTYDWKGGVARVPFTGVVLYEASDSEILELVVQEEPLPYYPASPLPNEYWSRPIDAQLWEWSTIAGNWLESARYQGPLASSPGPETGHILWAKPLEYGGLVGSELGYHSFEEGDAYEGKFQGSVIINGILYYNQFQPRGGSNVEQEVVAVDLRTGEELWRRNWDNQTLAFGQIFYWDAWNMHGAFPYLWTTVGSTWHAYDVTTGRWVYSIENVPWGTRVYGPKGEIYVYTVDLNGGWMTLWNSSRTVQPQTSGTSDDGSWRPQGNVYDARDGIEWNVTIPTDLPGGVNAVFFEDRIIGTNAPGEANIGLEVNPIEMWCISLKPGQEGTPLWRKSWQPPPGDIAFGYPVRQGGQSSLEDRVFVLRGKEIKSYFGFDMDTGEQIWGPSEPEPYMNIYSLRANIHLGKLYSTGYAGIVRAYDLKTGDTLWTYNASDPYNEILWGDNWPLIFSFFTPDRKIFVFTMEHSPIDPKPRGGPLICLDAETGEELWKINIYGTRWGGHNLIGDGIMVAFNAYDNRIYSIGKGPSATTVSAAPKAIAEGTSVVIEGTVMDISPGTNDPALKLRFPNGVPAISDGDMSEWMLYVYKQFPMPSDASGVEVYLDAVDPNGNFINIGTTTSDMSGTFSYMWTPGIEGKYTIIASFMGSESYWPSYAETAIGVSEAPPALPLEEPEEAVDYTPMFLGLIAAIVVVAILVLYTLWTVRKQRK